MPVYLPPHYQAPRQDLYSALGMTDGQGQLAADVLDVLLPAAGPSGLAAGLIDPPPQQPLPAATGLLPLALGLVPLMLGKASTSGQKAFKQVAKAVRDRLTGTAVTDPTTGKPQRVYHGTTAHFDQFDPARRGDGAGGDLYGPGYYFTEDADIAGNYTRATRPRSDTADFRRLQEDAGVLQRALESAKRYGDAGEVQQLTTELADVQAQIRHLETQGPNVRPAFLGIKRPFDVTQSYPIEAVAEITQNRVFQQQVELQKAGKLSPDIERRVPKHLSGEQIYHRLAEDLGSKAAANARLQALGYDGITHLGGSGTDGKEHRVWIAFDPQQVVPALTPGAPTHTRPTVPQRLDLEALRTRATTPDQHAIVQELERRQAGSAPQALSDMTTAQLFRALTLSPGE